MYRMRTLLSTLFALSVTLRMSHAFDPSKVIFAVNAGGDVHVDSNGIRYEKDPLRVGTASEHGKQLSIRRVAEKDFPLYQIERYHHSSFGYEIPVSGDGDYVLVLKFCEVWFDSRDSKVFDVSLNGKRVIENLDIYDKVGKGVAHDEYVPFSVRNNKLVYNNDASDINYGKIKVEFLKGPKDNPKINAIIVYRGSVHDFPPLRPLPEEEKPYHQRKRPSRKSLPKKRVLDNPYAYEDLLTSYWPLLVTIASVFPIVYCLCKM